MKVKLTELREMGEFKGVSATGKRAKFRVKDENTAFAYFEDGKAKELKLDTIRRLWEIEVPEPEEVVPHFVIDPEKVKVLDIPHAEITEKIESMLEGATVTGADASIDFSGIQESLGHIFPTTDEVLEAINTFKSDVTYEGTRTGRFSATKSNTSNVPKSLADRSGWQDVELFVTPKEIDVILVLQNMLYGFGDFSNVTCDMIAKHMDIKVSVIKGIVGSLVKKKVAYTESVTKFDEQFEFIHLRNEYLTVNVKQVEVMYKENSADMDKNIPLLPVELVADKYLNMIHSGAYTPIRTLQTEKWVRQFYKIDEVDVEYTRGIGYDFKIIKTRQPHGKSSWKGNAFIVGGERIRNLEFNGGVIKEPSRSLAAMEQYLDAVYPGSDIKFRVF